MFFVATIEQLLAEDFQEFDDRVDYGMWQWGDVSNKLLPAGRLLYDDFNQPMHGYDRQAVRCRRIENLAPVGEVEFLDCWSGRGQTYSRCWGYPEEKGEWAIDIIVLQGDPAFVALALDIELDIDIHGPPLRALRIWTRRELVKKQRRLYSYPRLAYCWNRLRHPRLLEAVLLSGLNFSALRGYPDHRSFSDVSEWMNLLDVAALSGETVIAQLLRDRGLVSNHFSAAAANWESRKQTLGKQFVDQADDKTFTMDASQIEAAAAAGINLNALSMNLDDMLGRLTSPCDHCGNYVRAALVGEGIHFCFSLLDAAIMTGNGCVASKLVALSADATRLDIDRILDRTEVYRCERASCEKEWHGFKVFAEPSARMTAAVDALRDSLRLRFARARETYALALHALNRFLNRRCPVVARALVFLIDAPPIARLYFPLKCSGLVPREIEALFGPAFGAGRLAGLLEAKRRCRHRAKSF